MYELWYWCHQRGEFCRLEGPDWTDFQAAASQAEMLSRQSGRVLRVLDLYSGEVLHQTGTVGYQTDVLPTNPVYW